jgi:U3 small nucleolar RNA-associated protein 13
MMQDLDNAVMDRNYLKASRLAFKLKKPGRMLSIVSTILSTPTAEPNTAQSTASAKLLARLVASFTPDDVAQALQYLRDWNTNARHCHCAQALLQALLTTRKSSVCLTVLCITYPCRHRYG